MTVRHVAVFRFAGDTTSAQVAAIGDALERMRDAVPGLLSFRHGPDIGVSEHAWDYGVMAHLEDAAAFDVYADHPVHRRAVTLIREVAEDVSTVQFAS